MTFRSLRWRVQQGHVLMILIFLPLAGWLIYHLVLEERLAHVDRQLALTAARIASEETEPPNALVPDTIWYRVVDENNQTIAESSQAPAITIPAESDTDRTEAIWVNEQRIVSLSNNEGRRLLIGMPQAEVYLGLEYWTLFAITVTVLFGILALVMGWWFAGKSLAPIQRFSETAGRMSRSKEYEAIDLADTYHELQELGEVLNETFASLHHSLSQQRQLTADASHELRTPLATILLEAESALRRERSPEEYKERIENSLAAANHLKQLVDGLLLLARSDSDQPILNTSPTELNELIDEAIQLIQPQADKRHTKIIPQLVHVTLTVDAERMKQVIVNLLANAIQHGGQAIHVHLNLEVQDGNAILRVEDNGRGIPEELLPRLFDRFFRGEASRSSTKGNLGLGLAICQTIVEAHGGTISAGPSKLGGACFTVSLPVGGGLPISIPMCACT